MGGHSVSRTRKRLNLVMKAFWIIKAGTTFADTAREFGDFDQWTRDSLGLDLDQVRIWDAEADQPLPDPSTCSGVVVTGSHAMVTDHLPWSVHVEAWIPELVRADVPLLGICYGHQLLAQAMDGQVSYHPLGREIGTVEVELLDSCRDDPLLRELPSTISVHAVHAQSVIQLPPGAVHLARNDYEPHHAFRLGDSAWGIQFHPEYDAPIMQSYIEHLADELYAANRDVSDVLRSVRETPRARDVLRRFTKLVHEKAS